MTGGELLREVKDTDQIALNKLLKTRRARTCSYSCSIIFVTCVNEVTLSEVDVRTKQTCVGGEKSYQSRLNKK